MLIIDDILFSPVKGILWIFREMYNATLKEVENEAEAVTAELTELYMMLETGRITEPEFNLREKELLDRMEMIERTGTSVHDEDRAEEEESTAEDA
jgi:hypothetical protein